MCVCFPPLSAFPHPTVSVPAQVSPWKRSVEIFVPESPAVAFAFHSRELYCMKELEYNRIFSLMRLVVLAMCVCVCVCGLLLNLRIAWHNKHGG